VLESAAIEGGQAGRAWRPTAYAEQLHVGPLEGRFVLSIVDTDGDGLVVTSTGQVSGVQRRLRARVALASPALLAGLYAASVLRVEEPPARLIIVPYSAGIGDLPWIHLAAGREVWFATPDVSVNDPAALPQVAPGPLDTPGVRLPRMATARVLLARDGLVTVSDDRRPVEAHQLRAAGVRVEAVVTRTESFPALPIVDEAYYQRGARRNTANQPLNRAAGEYAGDAALAAKRDSLYSVREFEQVQIYLANGVAGPRLRGLVYVTGGVEIAEGERLRIDDGSLITEGTIHLRPGARLEVVHGASTRVQPALLATRGGALLVASAAEVRVHGLVYVSRVIDVQQGARVDVVGAIAGNDQGLSLRNRAGLLVVRYDPAVVGTPGLVVSDRDQVMAWVAGWEELP
jgi:hypothetical protein